MTPLAIALIVLVAMFLLGLPIFKIGRAHV